MNLQLLPNDLVFTVSEYLETNDKVSLMSCSIITRKYRIFFVFPDQINALKVINLDYYDQFINIKMDAMIDKILSKHMRKLLGIKLRIPSKITFLEINWLLISKVTT